MTRPRYIVIFKERSKDRTRPVGRDRRQPPWSMSDSSLLTSSPTFSRCETWGNKGSRTDTTNSVFLFHVPSIFEKGRRLFKTLVRIRSFLSDGWGGSTGFKDLEGAQVTRRTWYPDRVSIPSMGRWYQFCLIFKTEPFHRFGMVSLKWWCYKTSIPGFPGPTVSITNDWFQLRGLF